MKNKYNLANIFEKISKDGGTTYLLNKSLYIQSDNVPPQAIHIYEWSDADTWFLISYKIYGTIDLWWLLCKMNDIVSPIEKVEAGTKIKILKKEFLESILTYITKVETVDEQLGL